MIIDNETRVELIWLLTRLLCYVPRPEDVTDDKRGYFEYHPKMLDSLPEKAKEQIRRLHLLGVTLEMPPSKLTPSKLTPSKLTPSKLAPPVEGGISLVVDDQLAHAARVYLALGGEDRDGHMDWLYAKVEPELITSDGMAFVIVNKDGQRKGVRALKASWVAEVLELQEGTP